MFVMCFEDTQCKAKIWGGASRQGAKRIRRLEQSAADGLRLAPENATLYGALSAQANYLAQDRPDVAFASKELCREFAVPTIQSYNRLKDLSCPSLACLDLSSITIGNPSLT